MELNTVLKQTRVIPVVVLDDATRAVAVARALLARGIGVIEITFRTAAAEAAIRAIRAEVPEMVIAAGTVLTEDELRRAKDAGVAFCVSPGLDVSLVTLAQTLGMPFIPGIATASELTAALKLGCTTVKFFPAEAAGGIAMVKSLMAAFGHRGVMFMPTGGISEATAETWLGVKGVVCVGGSWMMKSIFQEIGL